MEGFCLFPDLGGLALGGSDDGDCDKFILADGIYGGFPTLSITIKKKT